MIDDSRDLAAKAPSSTEAFTDRVTRPAPDRPGPATQAAADDDGIPMEGWLFSVLIPILGLVYGLSRLAKGQVGRGLAILIVATLGFLGWLVVLASQ